MARITMEIVCPRPYAAVCVPGDDCDVECEATIIRGSGTVYKRSQDSAGRSRSG